MRKRKLMASFALALALGMVTEIPAYAEPASGGDWVHGHSGGWVWSNYWHAQVNHGSSVNGHFFVDSGCKPPGVWAAAKAPSRWFGRSGAYYRFC